MNLQANINQLVGKVADIQTKKKIANKMPTTTPQTPTAPKAQGQQGLTMEQVDHIIASREEAMERVRMQVSSEYKQKMAFKTRIANLKKKVRELEGGAK